ncbi:MAG: ABC transporter permease [Acutalibacteraceae bacterium]|nr:ABC transporter permease [Acutalibacteraceae bacterium]
MPDLISAALKNILRKKGRSALTMSGIAIGVASVIIISCISSCGTLAVNEELDSLGLGGLTISASDGSTAPLTDEELAIITDFSEVTDATPVLIQTTEVYSQNQKQDAFVWGIDSAAKDAVSLKLLYGRFLNHADIGSSAKVCMVDRTFANTIYKRDNVVGKQISIKSGDLIENYSIVGVISTGSGLLQNAMGTYLPNFIYAPYTTVQESTGTSGYHQIILKVNDVSNLDMLSESILKKLNNANGVSDGYKATNLAKQRDILLNILDIVTLILSAVGAVSLVVASLSIMTVMLVSVSERTREIGIKKSIGAKKSVIMAEFLTEAALISLVGCIVGVIAGILISFAGANLFSITLNVNYFIIFFTCIFSLLTGVIFGVYPALKAAKLKPVTALRVNS